jgi:putative holliday junction resolvase
VNGWRRGVRLGIDVGTVRIGVARSDPDGILATPLATIPRAAPGTAAAPGTPATPGGTDASSTTPPPSDMSEIQRLVVEHDVVEVVVGMPVTLAGTERQAAAAIREYAARLAQLIEPVPVCFADERMSTVVATRRLSERGVRGKRQRAVVDQVAAVEILQGWLDAQRRQT